MITSEFEQFLNSFPKDQQFRIVDPRQHYWNRDRLEFTSVVRDATHFPAHRAEDEIKLAAKYTPFSPDKVMIEPAQKKRLIL
jgi:hypothetical protein